MGSVCVCVHVCMCIYVLMLAAEVHPEFGAGNSTECGACEGHTCVCARVFHYPVAEAHLWGW